jgi:type III secretion system YscQ/HrcQ family protein
MWREAADLKKGLGTHLLVLPITLSPLGTVFWIMSHEDMIKLTSFMMKSGSKTRAHSSEILQEGFYRYLVLEALDAVQGMQPLQDLTLQLSEEEDPFDKAFCIDVEIDIDQKSCWGRLAIPVDLRTAWIQHFSKMPNEYVPAEIARQTFLSIGVKTGSVILHQDEWETIKEGDFVLLDQGSYDAQKGTGIAMLMLQTTPIFNVKIKENKIELVDYAFYYEDNMEDKRQSPKQPTEKSTPSEGEVVALKELPLYVTVEIARLKITLDQLMHLNPGHTLELPIHPDQGVSLVVNGQKVGRAELVYLGEQLGLRILEIG